MSHNRCSICSYPEALVSQAKVADFKDCLQFRMACSIPQLNSIGLKTSPCFTPRVILKTKRQPPTFPDWFACNRRRKTCRYVSGTPCACSAWNNESCSIWSNALCRSRLANHISDSQAKDLPQTFSKTTIASSMPRPRRGLQVARSPRKAPDGSTTTQQKQYVTNLQNRYWSPITKWRVCLWLCDLV